MAYGNFYQIYMIKTFLFTLLIATALSQYNPTLSKDLCEITVASYCRPTKLIDWSCGPCKESTLQIQNVSLFINSTKATLGFISVSKKLDAITVVFRGTEPWLIKNWISDINFIAIDYPLCDNKCKVHQGFYYAYMDIHDQVLSKVKLYKEQYKLSKLIVIGHSLGGALAYHATAHLIKSGYKIDLLQTFGSPRVGNKEFSSWYQQIYPQTLKPRVTHGKDPVPHLPPKQWAFDHVQTEIFYQGKVKQGYKICKDSVDQDKSCSDKYDIDTNVIDHVTYYDIDFSATILACQ